MQGGGRGDGHSGDGRYVVGGIGCHWRRCVGRAYRLGHAQAVAGDLLIGLRRCQPVATSPAIVHVGRL